MTQSANGNGNDGPRRRNHPIDSVRWVPRSVVHANEYNPNRQVDENHALLIESIRADGWTQPIVVRPRGDDGMHVIVDGEHRWRAAAHLEDEHIPVVILDQGRRRLHRRYRAAQSRSWLPRRRVHGAYHHPATGGGDGLRGHRGDAWHDPRGAEPARNERGRIPRTHGRRRSINELMTPCNHGKTRVGCK